MSAAPPCVSVCVPTFNGAATIGASIDSVLGQTFTDFELLVVDDGSTDDTAAVVAARADPRLCWLPNSRNLGAQESWNRCLELARGQYVKLLPHDDLLHPQCLQRQLQVLQADRGQRLALCCCARDVIGPDGRVLLRRRGFGRDAAGVLTRAEVIRRCSRRGTNLVGEPGSVLCRLELARRVGRFDGRHPYVIDLDYWLRLLEHGDAWYDDEALASFRVWSGSWSVAIARRQSADFRALMARAQQRAAVPLNPWDRACGRLMPTVNSWARQLVYRWLR